MEEKEKLPDEFFKCVKVPLKHIIKHPDINIPKIQDTAIMSKFREIRNPKPAKNNSILSHGLLLCKKDCGLWNRDENSARNIYKIANNAINKKERPTYLSRSKVISGYFFGRQITMSFYFGRSHAIKIYMS